MPNGPRRSSKPAAASGSLASAPQESPGKALHGEHHAIRRLIAAVEGMAGALHEMHPVDPEDARKAVEALAGFADRCHHAKEERVLFPLLRRTMAAEAAPLLDALQRQHAESRTYVARLRECAEAACRGDPKAGARFEDAADRYSWLELGHIHREEADLLPLAERLGPEQRREVARAFEDVEAREVGEDAHGRFHRDIEDLAHKYARYARRPLAAA